MIEKICMEMAIVGTLFLMGLVSYKAWESGDIVGAILSITVFLLLLLLGGIVSCRRIC